MLEIHTGGSVTVVGLGPGDWQTLTLEAVDAMRRAGEVYLRTAVQPPIEPIRAHLPKVTFHSFDRLYETHSDFEAIYDALAGELMALAQRPGGVLYAVPGSPSLGETSVRLLRERASAAGIPVRLIQGISFVEGVLAAVGMTDASRVQVLEAGELALLASENGVGEVEGVDRRFPWLAPSVTAPTVVSHLFDRHTASGVKLWLGRYYPDTHEVTLVTAPGTAGQSVTTVPLFELDRAAVDHRATLYVPPLLDRDDVRTFAGLMNVTRTLRAPGGCPWDREQTQASLKPHLIEETYEVAEALDAGDPAIVAEELGDLLFQITIHSQIAAEAGDFTIEDVFQSIACKLIGRHPHVFGDVELGSAQEVLNVWESFKQREKPKRSSVLEEIPRGLPALPQSTLLQKRAAAVGFEWPAMAEVLDKVEEELEELRREVESGAPRDLQLEEFGDIIFALVSLARHLHVDPEEALRGANRKFSARFRYVESRVSGLGKSLRDLSVEELDGFWEEAKSLGGKYR